MEGEATDAGFEREEHPRPLPSPSSSSPWSALVFGTDREFSSLLEKFAPARAVSAPPHLGRLRASFAADGGPPFAPLVRAFPFPSNLLKNLAGCLWRGLSFPLGLPPYPVSLGRGVVTPPHACRHMGDPPVGGSGEGRCALGAKKKRHRCPPFLLPRGGDGVSSPSHVAFFGAGPANFLASRTRAVRQRATPPPPRPFPSLGDDDGGGLRGPAGADRWPGPLFQRPLIS